MFGFHGPIAWDSHTSLCIGCSPRKSKTSRFAPVAARSEQARQLLQPVHGNRLDAIVAQFNTEYKTGANLFCMKEFRHVHDAEPLAAAIKHTPSRTFLGHATQVFRLD